jgi:ribose transport system permease protein
MVTPLEPSEHGGVQSQPSAASHAPRAAHLDAASPFSASATGASLARRLIESDYLVYMLAITIFVLTCILVPGFTSWSSIKSLLVLASILGIASLGQTATMVLGGIDLSIAPMLGLSSVIVGRLATAHWAFVLIALILVLVGSTAGLFSGLFSFSLRAPALLVTLAVGYVLTAVALEINRDSAGGIVPGWVESSVAVNGRTLGIPIPSIVLVWIVAVCLLMILERRLPLMRRIYAAGTNPVAANLAMINVRALWGVTFAFSGLTAVIAGVFLAGFSGGADVSVGQPYLFLTIAAVVVGGTALTGGSGGQGRTMAGAFVITNLTILLLGLNISQNYQEVILGALICGVVAIHGREPHVSSRV